MRKAAIIGATGLIGGHILQQLTNDDTVEEIRVIVRRPMQASCPRIKVIQISFSDTNAMREALSGCDSVFCAIGTTRKKTPDLDEYRKIDFDIPVTAARLSAEVGVRSFHLVSSVGASDKKLNFYLKIKGDTEEAVKQSGLEGLFIYRPSLLLGNRKEVRVAEKLSTWIMPLIGFIFPPHYKPVQASVVASAMIRDAKAGVTGTKISHYPEMV